MTFFFSYQLTLKIKGMGIRGKCIEKVKLIQKYINCNLTCNEGRLQNPVNNIAFITSCVQ